MTAFSVQWSEYVIIKGKERFCLKNFFQEGLNGVNRQPSNGQKINRQPLTVNHQKRNIFTVSRQMSEPKLAIKFIFSIFFKPFL